MTDAGFLRTAVSRRVSGVQAFCGAKPWSRRALPDCSGEIRDSYEISDFMGINWRDNLNYVRSLGYRDE